MEAGAQGGAAVSGAEFVPAVGGSWSRTPRTEAEERVATSIWNAAKPLRPWRAQDGVDDRPSTAVERWQYDIDLASHQSQKPRPAPRAALPARGGGAAAAPASNPVIDPAMEGRPEGKETISKLRDEAVLKIVTRERLYNLPKGARAGSKAKKVKDKDYTNTCGCCGSVFMGSITRSGTHVMSGNCEPKEKRFDGNRMIRVQWQEMKDKQILVRADIRKYEDMLATLADHEQAQNREALRYEAMQMEIDGKSPLKLAGVKRKLETQSPLGFVPKRKEDHRSSSISQKVLPFSRDPSPFTLPASPTSGCSVVGRVWLCEQVLTALPLSQELDDKFALWIYAGSLPFSMGGNAELQDLLGAVQEYGFQQGRATTEAFDPYKQPGRKELGGRLLDQLHTSAQQAASSMLEAESAVTPVTIMSDGATYFKVPIINICAGNVNGSVYMSALDASAAEKKNADYIKDHIKAAIEKLGAPPTPRP